MKNLKTPLALLLCAALCFPMWSMAAENVALSEISLIPLVPATPSNAEEAPPISWKLGTPAEGDSLPGPEQKEPVEIYKFIDSNVNYGGLPILPLGSDITAALPETVYGYYSRFGLVECPVVWDVSVLTVPGRYTVSGAVTAPDGYILKEDAGLEQTYINLAVYEDEPVVFFDVYGMTEDGLHGVQVLALGGETPAAPYERVDMIGAQGDVLSVSVEWDFSSVRVDTLGQHIAFATPILPPGAGFVGEPVKIPQRYYVMEPNAVDLGAYDISGQSISCEWLTEIDPEQAALELSEDGEHWLAALDMMPEENISIYNTYLVFSTASLELEKEYFFRLVYQGRCDGVLRVTTTQDSILPPDWEGDRDGGDAGGTAPDNGDTGQKPPTPGSGLGDGNDGNGSESGSENVGGSGGDREDTDDSTPPPTPPPTITSPPPADTTPSTQPPTQPDPPSVPAMAAPVAEESDNFVELFGETRDLISGTRLLMMVDSGGQARFSKQGVTVTFSAEAVSRLGIQDSDRITVTIEKEAADRFSFSLLVNDATVTKLENTHVMVPYEPQTPGTALSLRDAEGTMVAKGSYEAIPAVVSFTVNTTGRFSIVEDCTEDEIVPVASVPQQPGTPMRPTEPLYAIGIVTTLLLAVTLGFLLKRRLHP